MACPSLVPTSVPEPPGIVDVSVEPGAVMEVVLPSGFVIMQVIDGVVTVSVPEPRVSVPTKIPESEAMASR